MVIPFPRSPKSRGRLPFLDLRDALSRSHFLLLLRLLDFSLFPTILLSAVRPFLFSNYQDRYLTGPLFGNGNVLFDKTDTTRNNSSPDADEDSGSVYHGRSRNVNSPHVTFSEEFSSDETICSWSGKRRETFSRVREERGLA